jgi:1-aminocyclopropane-1-carboxylate deaminase
MHIPISNIILQPITDETTVKFGVNLYVLRTDLNHPTISGNKLFKLKYNIIEAVRFNCNTLLTFGGAFSNHIAATAAAGKEYGLKTIGIIRGEKYAPLNPTLKFAESCGMELHYVPRNIYQDKDRLHDLIQKQFNSPAIYHIPEGGSNELGIKGCEEITTFIPINFDYITLACGTGATLTGIIKSLKENQKAIGFQVLKAEKYIENQVAVYLNDLSKSNWSINEECHFGGYAKIKNELISFIKEFEQTHQIPLDYVYTGKMMFGVYDCIKKGIFKKGETIVAVHTGGLQGNAGFGCLK